MKKTLCVLLSVVLALLFPILVLAKGTGVNASGRIMNNTTGVIGPLKTSTLSAEAKTFLGVWRGQGGDASKCLITFNTSVGGTPAITFYRRIDTNTAASCRVSGDYIYVDNASMNFDTLAFNADTGEPLYSNVQRTSISPGAYWSQISFVQYRAFLSAGGNFSNYNRIWMPVNNSADGAFNVTFDDGTTDPEEPEKPVEPGFWDGLLDFVKGIFIPPDGYFDEWFQTINDAYNERMGGASNLLTYIQQKFENLKNDDLSDSTLKITLPDNFYFKGFKGVTGDALSGIRPLLGWLRNVLTAIFVILTAIAAYKRILALVRN